jgi:PKD repeat protein
MKKDKWFLLGITLLMLISVSCKKDDTSSGTKAVFSYVADGFKVSFTNFSAGATSYVWDFGDGTDSSTLKGPTHVFPAKGQFLVKLTAKNETETSTFIDTVLITGPNIKIDGDFTDWTYVGYTHENAAGTGGTLMAVKTYASAGYLNFYLECTPDCLFEVMDLYLDTDNNPETGLISWMFPMGSGAEYLCEGSVPGGWGDVLKHTGPAGSGWDWDGVAQFPEAFLFSDFKTVDGKKIIEFSVKRSFLGNMSKKVNFAILESTSGYTEIGWIPLTQTPASKFLTINL